MERTFRPKGSSVKAVQVTDETIDYIADWCFGQKSEDEVGPIVRIPSFTGEPVFARMGDYLVLVKGEGFRVMHEKEFEDRYEPVRTARNGE